MLLWSFTIGKFHNKTECISNKYKFKTENIIRHNSLIFKLIVTYHITFFYLKYQEQRKKHFWFQIVFNCRSFTFYDEKTPGNSSLSKNLGNKNKTEEKKWNNCFWRVSNTLSFYRQIRMENFCGHSFRNRSKQLWISTSSPEQFWKNRLSLISEKMCWEGGCYGSIYN